MGHETRAMDIRPVESVIWSDESKFEIIGSNRRNVVRRNVGERMISACVVPTMKHGGGGGMVWGCLASDTVSDLFRIQGTLNQHGYHSILQKYAIPSGLLFVGLSFVFQQDNDPKHTSRLCKGYLAKESDGVLHQMTWPPQSPNLNPIEMVWDELDRRVKKKQPTSAQHMWDLLQAFLMKLVERMQRVCKAVIKATGGKFEESHILNMFLFV